MPSSLSASDVDALAAAAAAQHEGFAPVKDRLTTTLFLAALFHGIVILGLSFATPLIPPMSPAPTFDVLLLTDQGPNEANPNAQYLAQRGQKGTGTTMERVRPASPPASPLMAETEGTADGDSSEYRKPLSGNPAPEVVASRADTSELAYRSGTDTPQQAETPLALSPTAPSPISTSQEDASLRLRGKNPREIEITADTRESRLAPYLDAWKRKVERIGTLNYPMDVRRRAAALENPVLEVSIRSNGALAEINVRRSSGRKEIDQAAVAILKLAAPFDPFPPALKKEYDRLRFAYEWQFMQGSK
jgi:protein TonB